MTHKNHEDPVSVINQRRSTAYIPVIAMCATLAVQADADMRCGTEIIQTGDSALRVLEACGKPLAGDPEDVDEGEWTYNFGPDEFMMKVVIMNGKVQRFEQLGRGFQE